MNRTNKLGNVIRGLIYGGDGSINNIPHIDLNNFWGDGVSGKLNDYRTKQAQLKANIGWVYSANQAIADEASAVELKLYRKKPDGDREEIFEHEILDLIKRPNGWLTGSKFWNLYYQYMNLTGEAYILKMRNGEPLDKAGVLPHALHILPSHLADLQLADTREDSSILFLGRKFALQSMIRDINPDPENPYVGRSVVKAAAITLDMDYQMKDWNRSLFANGVRPSAVIEVPDVMEDEAYERLKKQLDEANAGSDNAFKKIIIEGGAKLAPYSMSQQDLDFLASRKFSKDEIFAMFRTSPSIVGMTEDVNRANAEAQDYTMAKRVTVPRVRSLKELLNIELVEPFDPTLELDFDSPVPEDEAQKLAEDEAGLNNWLTIDEVREKRGLPALPNGAGAVLYRPLNEVPITMLADSSTTDDDGDVDVDLSKGKKKLKMKAQIQRSLSQSLSK